ncbi:syntaxin 5 [Babesia microti strain RI]|uniref:Syntaxin 5 n=1 Tax=Babesia microti (strain RI) TaxID=1133968 RepID=A0A1R4ABZ4_BABMR|nr:syntaxin 5 [Babesia microti strain RI]SJK86532.1 syntaxin 5 [Babesia microti strain RI]|eukprot:XP_021338680.1 syntaxin 5 [Babesia microti strain RI]
MAGYIDRTNIFHYEIARLGGTTPSILNKEYNKNHIDEQSNNVKNELNSLDLKLDRLAELSKRSGIYSDNSDHLNHLINQIKKDLSDINENLETLSTSNKQMKYSNKHTKLHYANIVDYLKSSFVSKTNKFKDILQQRTETMKKQENRRKMYTFRGNTSLTPSNNHTSSFVLDEEIQQVHDRKNVDIESGQVIKNRGRQNYIAQARQEAIVNVQRAIWDLSQIFNKVAQMVSEQDMMIQRIDEETDISIDNIKRGQIELSKYLKKLSSRRGLIIRMLCIIFVFIIIFVLIIR